MSELNQKPPRWADRLLEWFCTDHYLEIIQGDLRELYQKRLKNMSRWRCNLLYIKDVLDIFRPFALKKITPVHQNNTIMLKNYFKVSMRNFVRNKSYALLNLGGLIIGMVSVIFITLYVQNEKSYDAHFAESEKIMRIRHDLFRPGGELIYSRASGLPALAGALREKLPGVEHATNFYQIRSSFRHDENAFIENNVLLADSTFFDVFAQPIIEGDKNKLGLPNTVIISESTAQRYFGKSRGIIGKNLVFTGSDTSYEVIAIMEDLPFNTHFEADILLSNYHTPTIFGRDTDHQTYFNSWGTTGWFTYIKTDLSLTEFNERLEIFTNEVNKAHKDQRSYGVFIAQPLSEIYLTSKFRDELNKTNGNASLVQFLSLLTILIMCVAWLNYINLTTARAVERAKEVGLRKVVGSDRRQIRLQFLMESMLYNIAALIVAVFLVWATWNMFTQFVDKPVLVNLFGNIQLWGILVTIILIGALAAGAYPAFVISNLKPTVIISGKFKSSSKGIFLRKALITTQFMIAIFLCIGTIASYSQLKFMLNQDKGFDMANLISIRYPVSNDPDTPAKFNKLVQELRQESTVTGVASSSGIPGILQLGGRFYTTDRIEESLPARRMFIDDHFFDVFDISIIEGRNFYINNVRDTINSVIINEQAAKSFGYEKPADAIHQTLLEGDRALQIIGVVNNYAQVSYQFEQPPIVFYFNPEGAARLSIKFDEGESAQILSMVKKKFEANFPDSPLQFIFVDEFYNRLFNNDQQFSKTATAFTFLAILVALLGLIGFVSYSVSQRNKEIGVRKVMGASVKQILLLIANDFFKVIVTAGILAMPLAYLVVAEWQQTYVLKQSLGFGIYIFPVIGIATMALLIVIGISFKTASRNPVHSLRYE
ncbi:MAG: ABC transporter permease [Fulvivirga sp.]|nr:ABC transporter permease [Fulvivirga sp.]